MNPEEIEKLRRLTTFPALVNFLRDELDWPIEVEYAEDLKDYIFDYDPAELGIDPKHAVKIESIKQVRPLADNQPWGIFYIEFETKRLPVVVLRRILRALVPRGRGRDPDRPVWRMSDLMFISAQGEAGHRSISFAHFHQRQDRLPELRTFSWDSQESHFFYLQNLNLEALRWPAPEVEASATDWRAQWGQAFTVEHRYVIQTARMLAREMARQARTVRELVEEIYDLEAAGGPLHRLYDSFKEVLLHDLTPEAFADMVAQTVAYGLFSAAAQSDELPTLEHMVELIPKTNPFLKELLSELTTEGAVDLEELGVGQLVELLWQTDFEAILQDFGRQSGGGREDPVVHFYEDFLREYDKEQKVLRGVFYTPDPVVSYIVRSVDYLLRTEFGLEDGLADTSVDEETGEPLVQILDPATGTGTFLAHVIDQIEATVKAKGDVDWNAYVAEHLLPCLNGFELMMAPYAVAHMKLGLKLRQTGYDFRSGERLRVYLTNTLEEPVEAHETLAFTGFLSKESSEAARVKRQTPITAVIGNPPYSVSSANKGQYIEGLLERYKAAVHEERNIQPLSDDYIKFIRFAQDRIERTGSGILGMITNHAYLSGLIHRGMRRELMRTFSEIYILDLHGNAVIGEKAPNGSRDENVFDIRQGVAIAFFVRTPGHDDKRCVRHADLWGLRDAKYRYMLGNDVGTTDWEELHPQEPHFFFVPKDFQLREEYERWWSLSELYPVNAIGVKPRRDYLLVEFERERLVRRFEDIAMNDNEEELKARYGIRDTRYWTLKDAREHVTLNTVKELVQPYLYRPFDMRSIYYNPRIIERGDARWPVLRHMLGNNLALLTMRRIRTPHYEHFFVAQTLVNKDAVSITDNCNVFPLYLNTTPEDSLDTLFAAQEFAREPNVSSRCIATMKRTLGLQFVLHGRGDLQRSFGPEAIFYYAYAVFHSPSYRNRYAEFLKIDFPRLPVTSDLDLFRSLCALGADLVALHLLKDDYPHTSWSRGGRYSPLKHPITTFVERATGRTVGAFSKSTCYQGERVYLDTSQRSRSSYFDGVPEEVWNFHIGGYQVCRKWLYDRRGVRGQPGRTLTPDDIAHYQRIVVALKETIRLMDEIDEVIEEHGGWPIE